MTNNDQSVSRHDSDKDKWAMVGRIVQALILACIYWTASSISAQNTAITRLQVQVESVQTSLSGIPDLSSRVTRLETNQTELMRRQTVDDSRWKDLDNSKMKGWTR